ncbi:MAG: sigma-54 dependent transcriptional regulator [Bacteroidales bacterium]
MQRVLIIDDDIFICQVLEKLLNDHGYEVSSAFSASSAKKILKNSMFDVVLCDYRLPDSNGMEILRTIRQLIPAARVVIITAYADVKIAVKLIKEGAADYIVKPVQHEEILHLLGELSKGEEQKENEETFKGESFFFGDSPQIKEVLKLSETVAPTNMSVIINGETGTGKEYLARFIHARSERRGKPFIALDCGAIPKTLANSELFGHIKGSFTGAHADKTGVFQEANGGTLFLDEIGNLDYEVQVKLLRALQERVVTRVGDTKTSDIDVRIIVASNEDLRQRVANNSFREDLFHRINEFMIHLPPLRERKEDIEAYAGYFMKQANDQLDKNISGFDEVALEHLLNYAWEGNLRELRNMIKRSVLLTRTDKISISSFPEEIRNFQLYEDAEGAVDAKPDGLKKTAREAERELIIDTLRMVDNNKSKAARILNVDRKTLYNKMKLLNITVHSSPG